MYVKSVVISGNRGSKSNTIGDDIMEFKKCPNCGLGYNDGSYYCMKCNVRLKPAKEVDHVKHPELSAVEDRRIGTVSTSSANIPKCPTCGSTNVQPIGTGEKVISGALFGLFSTKIRKSYKCNNCKYMW